MNGPSLAEVTPISEIMTKHAICVSSTATIDEVARRFFENGISGAPVIDERGQAVGVISKTDVLRERMHDPPRSPDRRTVGEVMTPVAFTIKETAPISQAAAMMAFEQIHRLPIVSERGEVIGIVSAIDVLRWMVQTEGYLAHPDR